MRLTDIYNSIFEARVIDANKTRIKEPLKDDDVIRVYHGFGQTGEPWAWIVATFGLSGKVRAKRSYSYEYRNNPNGLFVTINPKVAFRDFSNSGVAIEFHTPVSDLEPPVWAGGGGYFGQGQMAQTFSSDQERELQKMENRRKFKDYDWDVVAKSDRPDVAFWLLEGPEQQALYVGDLNPNMIRAIWVHEGRLLNNTTTGDWKRMSVSEFLSQYPPEKYAMRPHTTRHGSEDRYTDSWYDAKGKVFKPNDNYDEAVFCQKYKGLRKECSELISMMVGWIGTDLEDRLSVYMWPKQLTQFKAKYKNK